MSTLYFVPTCFFFIGVTWLVGSYSLSSSVASVVLEHVTWPEVANCSVLEVRQGFVFGGVRLPRQPATVCAKLDDQCTPLCVVLAECPVVKQNSTAVQFETLYAISTTELFPQVGDGLRSPPYVFCNATQSFAASDRPRINILRNSHNAETNYTLTSLECSAEDFGCCKECSELDSTEQILDLASTFRTQIFVSSMGLGVALIVSGAIILIVAIFVVKVRPWLERAQFRRRLQQGRPRRQPEIPVDVRNLNFNDHQVVLPDVNAAPARAARSGGRRHRSRRRGRDRRNNGEPQQQPSVEMFDDDFDTSPSVAAPVAVICKGCATPFDSNTLACTRCGKVSEEHLERAAFDFGGGELEPQCTVCLDDIEAGTRVVTLPCAHLYHIDCIAAWLDKKNVCPQCLTIVK